MSSADETNMNVKVSGRIIEGANNSTVGYH
jgi:hypothetical protein